MAVIAHWSVGSGWEMLRSLHIGQLGHDGSWQS